MYLAERLPQEQTARYYPTLFNDYLTQAAPLRPFYGHYPATENVAAVAEKKLTTFSHEKRIRLCDVLTRQYASFGTPPKAVIDNLARLRLNNTLTLTTGHQLTLFLGPLYLLYKIITTLNTAKALSLQHPRYHFVPIYWMLTEDHDVEEMATYVLFQKKAMWQSQQKGTVGNFSTAGISELLEKMPANYSFFREAYSTCKTLAAATRHYMTQLFGEEGLVVLDADTKDFKASFGDVMANELLHNTAYEHATATGEELRRRGYKAALRHLPCSLMYKQPSTRTRIKPQEGAWQLGTARMAKQEVLSHMREHPTRFSPDVLLRTLYQEWILPNVAYVGGPHEIAYWLQLKDAFRQYDIPFPLLVPRFRGAILLRPMAQHLTKHHVDVKLLLTPKEQLPALFFRQKKESLDEEKAQWQELLQEIKRKIDNKDTALAAFVHRKSKEIQRNLQAIEKKILAAKKEQAATTLHAYQRLRDVLLPLDKLQEREVSFLSLYAADPQLISKLAKVVMPFDFSFFLLQESAEN